MATTHNVGSSKSLPGVGRHDGHSDGHLNCVALRHGWSRAFSISPTELRTLDYDTLSSILEINTLKLRPMGVRIYIENPADSNQWSKLRYWKNDTSLQSTLVLEFLERRRVGGIVMRVDVRDGNERNESDGVSLRSVATIVLKRKNSNATDGGVEEGRSPRSNRWFGLSRNTSVRSRTRTAVATDAEDDDEPHHEVEEDRPPPTPPKPSFFSLLRPHPNIPNSNQKRRSIFDFFRDKLSNKPPTTAQNTTANANRDRNRNINPFASITSRTNPFSRNPFASLRRTNTENHTYEPPTHQDTEDEHDQEAEQLRKRGWIPPGLIRRQKSLKDRLGKDDGERSKNPFFGSSKSGMSRAERRGKATATATANGNIVAFDTGDEAEGGLDIGNDPFGDNNSGDLHGPEEVTEEDLDNFFEIERTESIVEMENRPPKDKPFSKFRSKERKAAKKKASSSNVNVNEEPVKGTLGGGAAIVQRPRDAFPDSGHRFEEDVAA